MVEGSHETYRGIKSSLTVADIDEFIDSSGIILAKRLKEAFDKPTQRNHISPPSSYLK